MLTLLPDSQVRDRLHEAAGSQQLSLADLAARWGTGGHAAQTVPLVLVACSQFSTLGFQSLLRQLVAIGGDTDTQASLAGQVLGARLGIDNLPQLWIERLPERTELMAAAERFADAVQFNFPR